MWLQLQLPSEIAFKALGLGEVTLDGSKAVIVGVTDPGELQPGKTAVAVHLRRGLMQRLRRLARDRRRTITGLLEGMITEEAAHASERPLTFVPLPRTPGN